MTHDMRYKFKPARFKINRYGDKCVLVNVKLSIISIRR